MGADDMNRSQSTDQRLRFAIANKRLLQFRYHAHLRVAEPHDYGLQKGVQKLLIYHVGGSSSTHPKGVRGWRLLEVSKIEACVVLEETFPGSRGQAHRHLRWDVVYARVE